MPFGSGFLNTGSTIQIPTTFGTVERLHPGREWVAPAGRHASSAHGKDASETIRKGLIFGRFETEISQLTILRARGFSESISKRVLIGESVPDRPNSYGYNMFLFPPRLWIGEILYEHAHRLMAQW